MDWSLNPYTGCSHACAYCYASFMKRFTGHKEDWGTFVDAKTNVADVLERQVRRKSGGTVMLASVTDAWQPLERKRRLTRRCLEVLAGSGLSLAAITKSDLVVRDIDLLTRFGDLLGKGEVSVAVTLTTLSGEIASFLEPGAASPSRRLEAIERLSEAGIRTWVFVAPLIPGLTDSEEDFASLVRQARLRGASEVEADPLNFYPAAVRQLGRLIARRRPGALPAWREALARPDDWRVRAREMCRGVLDRGDPG